MKLLFLLTVSSTIASQTTYSRSARNTESDEPSYIEYEEEVEEVEKRQEGFEREEYDRYCGENVDESGQMIKTNSTTRKLCRKFNKDLLREALKVHYQKAVTINVGESKSFASEEEALEAVMAGAGMGNMLFDVDLGSVEPQPDPECSESNIETSLENGHCCEEGKFHEHQSIWEVEIRGLKTLCGCFDNHVTCEEPNQEAMVQKRSRCSLRSNWYVKNIQKLTMKRNPATDGQIIIRSLVGTEGFKVRENQIFSYMSLECHDGEFELDGELLGTTFDFECLITKSARRGGKRAKREDKKGEWRTIPECKRQTALPQPESEKPQKQKGKKEKAESSFGDFDSISARILGGTKVATNGEYPWQCLLVTSSGSFCGCVVIDEKLILTAAHCVLTAADNESSDFENGVPRALTALAILGTVDRLSTFSQRIKTSLCGIHPGFKADGPIMYYDIAFCQLRAAIRFDDDRAPVKPACLPGTLEESEERRQKMCVATGFGTTSSDPENQGPSDEMMSAIVPIWQFGSCKRQYGNKLKSVHLCAGGLGTDTCQGDSGGALQCQIPVGHESFQRCNGWFVRGITSFGKGCNRIGSPGVYVDLSTTGILMWIYDWIKVSNRRSSQGKAIEPGKLYELIERNTRSYITEK